MRNRIRITLTLAAALVAAGCTTVPEAERSAACQATDWLSYGRNDGLLGVPASERTEHFADCAKLGYPADAAAYQAGRAEGLLTYCTVDSGLEVGASGRRYRKVCPPELEQAFLQGYEQGRKEYRRSYPYGYPNFGIGIGIGGYHNSGGWGARYGYPGWWW